MKVRMLQDIETEDGRFVITNEIYEVIESDRGGVIVKCENNRPLFVEDNEFIDVTNKED